MSLSQCTEEQRGLVVGGELEQPLGNLLGANNPHARSDWEAGGCGAALLLGRMKELSSREASTGHHGVQDVVHLGVS